MLKAPLTCSLPLLALLSAACSGDVRRFPLRDPVWRDADLNPVSVPCSPDPEALRDDPQHRLCTPAPYESSFAWDAADNLVFRPVTRFFAVDPGGEAVNVNSLDEVPDSSWFTNRIGKQPLSAEELVRGPCGDRTLDDEAPDGSWVIDMGKPNGANPGFRIKVEGIGKFMLKADPSEQPERATGATAIAARLYHAAGFWAPCDSVVYLKPSVLKLSPGLTVTDNSGTTRPFDQAALDGVLAKASKRGDRVRMVASRWLPGRALGPFKYEGTREDDPNDVIPHEDRRDLRGGRLLAAWLNHFDSREQNSMDVWLAEDGDDKDASPGHVRHYAIDLGDCFGSEWEWEDISKRLGHAYYFDVEYALLDFATLGIPERPWDRATRDPQGDIFGFFSDRDFRPEDWRGGYPNPAFARMTELDGAWAARALARFTPELIEAAVRTGDFTAPRHTAFLIDKLIQRKRAILARYLTRLSPIADVALASPAELCGVDLARRTGVARAQDLRYEAAMYAGEVLSPRAGPVVRPSPDGRVCLSLPHIATDGGAPDDAPSRYAIVDLLNGQAPGPLRAHLYDLGPRRGYKLVGIERPDEADPPD
ncbi:hypothetical protein WME75_32810 [Sorangium sp. So ce1014]|uniref:hypothetical protein n=1 Tax=Sorangium sp. So ce1014 TaxID=3133326 RepID=UPI003F5DB124